MRVASYDIGSNSIILLVAERDGQGVWQPIEDHVDVARISEGLDAHGVLGEPGIARAEAVLRRFTARARSLGVDEVVVTGTAPFRRANNGPDVAVRLARTIGTAVDVISGEREAELALLATQRAFPDLKEMLVVDIGGASTELIRASENTSAMVSIDIGSVRLTERCVRNAPLKPNDHSALALALDTALFTSKVEAILSGPPVPMVGIAGTVTTVLTAALGMDVYDPTVVHGSRLSLSAIDDVFTRVSSVSLERRKGIAGVPPKRADVLPAGAALLGALVRRAGVDHIRVSDRGTRWGRLHAEFDRP